MHKTLSNPQPATSQSAQLPAQEAVKTDQSNHAVTAQEALAAAQELLTQTSVIEALESLYDDALLNDDEDAVSGLEQLFVSAGIGAFIGQACQKDDEDQVRARPLQQ